MFDFNDIDIQDNSFEKLTTDMVVDHVAQWLNEMDSATASVHDNHIFVQPTNEYHCINRYYNNMVRTLSRSDVFSLLPLLPHPITYHSFRRENMRVYVYLNPDRRNIENEAQVAYLWLKKYVTGNTAENNLQLIIQPGYCSMIQLETAIHMLFDRLKEMGVTVEEMENTSWVQIYTADDVSVHQFATLKNCYLFFEVEHRHIRL